VECAHTLLTH
jgi:peptide/nickel transport system permease protein